MSEFLEARRLGRMSRVERTGLSVGVVLIGGAAAANSVTWLSATSTGFGVALIGAACGSIAKDWRWRRLFSRYRVDAHAVVYVDRAGYGAVLPNIATAARVEIVGISLGYALEYVRDNAPAFFRRVRSIRVMLPAMKVICDERDRVQGSAVGNLWKARGDAVATLTQLMQAYPTQIEVGYLRVTPYAAITRVDDAIWVSPYVHKSGSSCPVLAVTKEWSPVMFALYHDYLDALWTRHTTPDSDARAGRKA
jgi:hypothetical protein